MKEPLITTRIDDESEKRIVYGKIALEEALEKAKSNPKFYGLVSLQIEFQAGKVPFTKVDYSHKIRD